PPRVPRGARGGPPRHRVAGRRRGTAPGPRDRRGAGGGCGRRPRGGLPPGRRRTPRRRPLGAAPVRRPRPRAADRPGLGARRDRLRRRATPGRVPDGREPDEGPAGRRGGGRVSLSEFQHPLGLILLLVPVAIVVGYVLAVRPRRRPTARCGPCGTPRAGDRGGRRSYPPVPAVLLVLALVSLIAALAGPRTDQQGPRNRATVMPVVDVSLS